MRSTPSASVDLEVAVTVPSRDAGLAPRRSTNTSSERQDLSATHDPDARGANVPSGGAWGPNAREGALSGSRIVSRANSRAASTGPAVDSAESVGPTPLA